MIVNKLYIRLFFIFYFLIFLFKLFHINQVTKYIIPIFVFGIFMFSLENYKKKGKIDFLISMALMFAFFGDFIINVTNVPSYCIIPFSLTHICLASYYFNKRGFKLSDLLILLPILLIGGLIYFVINYDISSIKLRIICLVYFGILNLMLWRALCLLKLKDCSYDLIVKIVLGSLLFYCTDIFVCLYTIYHKNIFVILIWAVYPAALGFLSIFDKPILILKSKSWKKN